MARIGLPPMPGPDTKVVELRVSWGVRAEDVLDAVSAVDVAGDGVHRLVRPADRLRRPAPGPVLQAGGRSTPRVTEAYVPPARPRLVPFGLLDVARWAADGTAGWALRAAGLLLGMVLVCVPGMLAGATWLPSGLPSWSLVLPAMLAAACWARFARGWLRWMRLGCGLATCAGLVVFGPVTAVVLAGVYGVLSVVFAVLLGLRARPGALPRSVRPLLGGWLAAPVLVLAGLLAAGLVAAAAGVLSLADPAADLPMGYRALGAAWLVGGLVVAVGWAACAGRVDHALLSVLHPGADARIAAAAWRRAAAARSRIWLPVALCGGVIAGLAVGRLVPGWPGYAGLVVPVALLACGFGRGPVSGLPGALRAADAAVDVLAGRARRHLAEEQTRVVLVGHGHGGLFAVLAALRLARTLPDAQRARLGLLTVGAPVRWLYLRVLRSADAAALTGLSRDLGGRWRSLCRGTDPFGGAVTAWHWQVSDGELLGSGLVPGGGPGALTAAAGQHGVQVLGADHWLPDPARGPVLGRRWAAGVRAHRDYPCASEWDAAIAVAAGLSTSDVEQPMLFRLPENWLARRPA